MKIIDKKYFISKWHIISILVFVVVLVLINCIIRARFNFSIDYNEGWNAFFSKKIINGELLYSYGGSNYISNNYPPFSFYIIAFFGKITGNVLFTGRFISLFSLLSISFIVSIIVKKAGGSYYESIFSGIFCLGIFSILANHYVGMNDPQLFGNFFGTSALLLYLNNNRKHLFFITLLLTMSVFIKHSLIILPISLLVDLFFDHYKKVLNYILFMCINISLFIVLIFLISEQKFFSQIFILETSRNFSVYHAIKNSIAELAWIQIPIVVGLVSLYFFSKERVSRTILIYILFSIVIGVYFTGGDGVDINVFFDLFISLSIAVGFTLKYSRTYFEKEKVPHSINWLLPLIMSFGLILQSPNKLFSPFLLKKYSEREKEFLNDAQIVRKHGGLIISEDILLAYSSGKEFVFDPFSVSQLLRSGKLDEKELIKDIELGKYSLIQLNRKINAEYKIDSVYGNLKFSGMYTANAYKAIEKHYSLFHISGERVFYCYDKN